MWVHSAKMQRYLIFFAWSLQWYAKRYLYPLFSGYIEWYRCRTFLEQRVGEPLYTFPPVAHQRYIPIATGLYPFDSNRYRLLPFCWSSSIPILQVWYEWLRPKILGRFGQSLWHIAACSGGISTSGNSRCLETPEWDLAKCGQNRSLASANEDGLVKYSSEPTSLIKCKIVVSWFDGFRRYADKRIECRLDFWCRRVVVWMWVFLLSKEILTLSLPQNTVIPFLCRQCRCGYTRSCLYPLCRSCIPYGEFR